MRYYFLDNNIFNFAVTGPGGAVINQLNESIASFPELRQAQTAFCMTPLSLLEALGTKLPETGVKSVWPKGAEASKVVGDVVGRAKQAFLDLPELSPATIAQRIQERRSFIPKECVALFDICVANPGMRSESAVEIANVLAWDHALKVAYPKERHVEITRFFLTFLIAARAGPMISRFRIIKRVWDTFYQRPAMHIPEAQEAIDRANLAMRLKTTRDFVDCDLLHLACFGWEGHDIVAFTCDPREVICSRISVYKGMVEMVRGQAGQVPEDQLPYLKNGKIAFCRENGEILDLVSIRDLPKIG